MKIEDIVDVDIGLTKKPDGYKKFKEAYRKMVQASAEAFAIPAYMMGVSQGDYCLCEIEPMPAFVEVEWTEVDPRAVGYGEALIISPKPEPEKKPEYGFPTLREFLF